MLQQKPPLIVKIGTSVSTAIFDCGITNERVFNVNSKLDSVKFYSGTVMQKPRVQHEHTVVG